MVTNQHQRSDELRKSAADLSLIHYLSAFALFVVLIVTSNAEADEDSFSSTIEIESLWYSNEQVFEWNVTGNNLSKLDIWYTYGSDSVDNTTWILLDTFEDLQNETDFTFDFSEGAGYYLLESNLFNVSGNSELGGEVNFTGELIKFDDIRPASTTTLDSGFQPTNSSIDIPWSATDNFLLKSVQLEYRFSPDSQSAPENWINYQTKSVDGVTDSGQFSGFSFVNGEGRYDFRITARDHAGNEESANIDVFIVFDGTAAQGNYTYDGEFWVAGSTEIPWQINDNYELYSMDIRYCYKPDNSSGFGPWESFTTISLNGISDEGTFDFNFNDGQGIYNFWLIANDEAGNSNPDTPVGQGRLSLGYDTEAPSGVMDYNGDFWHSSEVTIQHSSQDNVDVSEVMLYYRFKDDNFSAYSNYIFIESYATSGGTVSNGIMKADALSGSGFYQFRIEVVDSAGNSWVSPSSSFIIGFDMETPEIFLLNVDIESSYIFYNDEVNVLYYSSSNAVTDKEIEITGYCHDPTSSIVEGSTIFESTFAIFTDDSEGSTWSTTFTFAPFTSGNQTITISALDYAGNLGTMTISVVDDIDPPETSIALIWDGEVVDETEDYTISRETMYSLSSYDAISGEKIIEYRFDEGDWLTYEGEPFTVPPKTDRIDYRATDYVGNQENFSSLAVELINAAPTATIHSPSSSSLTIEKDERIYFNGSGVDIDGDILEYKWVSDKDGVLSNKSNFNTTDLSAGTHKITFSVKDDEGVWSIEDSVTVEVSEDRTIIYLSIALIIAGAVVCYNIYINRFSTNNEAGKEPDESDLKNESPEEEISSCPNCDFGIRSSAKFCNNCGYDLKDKTASPKELIECVSCGEYISLNKSFCKHCGKKAD